MSAKFVPNSTVLWRGQRPKSFEELKVHGIKLVVNLQSGVFETFTNTPYEYEEADQFGMEEIELECSDFSAPTYSQVLFFIGLVAGARSAGRRVFVHCLHGKDRTGFMVAMWRIYNGMDPHDAVVEMFEHGFHRWPYFYWVPKIHWYAHKLRKSGRIK